MNIITLQPLPKPVRTTVSVPGSKSMTNRALVIAALTHGTVVIHHPLVSDDTHAMTSCLSALGIPVEKKKDKWIVSGGLNQVTSLTRTLPARLSGTTIRFLTALACIVPGVTTLSGEPGLNARPIRELVSALQKRGAGIEYLRKTGFPPIRVRQSQIKSGVITISGTTSSQFISALLMILPMLERSTVSVRGKTVSRSYIDMTIALMAACGVAVCETKPNHFEILHGCYTCRDIEIESDVSSACYVAAIAALTQSTITIRGMRAGSVQPDMQFLSILSKMGSRVLWKSDAMTIQGKGVRPLSVDMSACPDQIQTLAVLAAFAQGNTIIEGIGTLRVKETNRVRALQTELARMGIRTSATKNVLTIFGGRPQPARIRTHGDHRMAMAFAVAGAKISGMQIENPDVVNKTFPEFWMCMRDIGITMEKPSNIVLIGFMGSGKSSVAPRLSRALGWKVVDMDALVLLRSKRASIQEIFAKDGEKAFRRLEETVAQSLVLKSHQVIAAGGGVVMNEKTLMHLQNNATIIFLKTSLPVIKARLRIAMDRPLWNDKRKARDLFITRAPLYRKSADITITTDNKSLSAITAEIILETIFRTIERK